MPASLPRRSLPPPALSAWPHDEADAAELCEACIKRTPNSSAQGFGAHGREMSGLSAAGSTFGLRILSAQVVPRNIPSDFLRRRVCESLGQLTSLSSPARQVAQTNHARIPPRSDFDIRRQTRCVDKALGINNCPLIERRDPSRKRIDKLVKVSVG